MDFGERLEIFRALIGSHNYNMNDLSSDKDYKLFLAPTFADLYFNQEFHKIYIGKTEDFDVHDIRGISRYFWKANINFLEVLFSDDIVISPDASKETKKILKQIFDMKDDIARMNLPYLWDACMGMHYTKKNQVDKGTEGTQHLVDMFGYDTKQAQHSIRVLNFLQRFSNNGFKDFKKAIWYKDTEPDRILLQDIKGGKYLKEAYVSMCEVYKRETETYRDNYKSQEPNEETNEKLISLVKQIVRENI